MASDIAIVWLTAPFLFVLSLSGYSAGPRQVLARKVQHVRTRPSVVLGWPCVSCMSHFPLLTRALLAQQSRTRVKLADIAASKERWVSIEGNNLQATRRPGRMHNEQLSSLCRLCGLLRFTPSVMALGVVSVVPNVFNLGSYQRKIKTVAYGTMCVETFAPTRFAKNIQIAAHPIVKFTCRSS